MKRLLALAVVATAVAVSACVSITVKDDDAVNWTGQNAQPFDAALEACRRYAGRDQDTPAFAACMAEKGWSRGD